MSKRWLVMYEISQKQRYIFRSNRLRENIGASTIIRWLTETPELFFQEWHVRKPEWLHSTVGGGNALYVFESQEEAKAFANELSFGVLKHLPGLELFLVTESMDWDMDRLYGSEGAAEDGRTNVIGHMRNRLAAKKNRREHAIRQYTWGIHQLCADSGMPANDLVEMPDSDKPVARAKELIVKEEFGRKSLKDFDDRFLKGLDVVPDNGKKLEFMTQEYLEEVLDKEKSAKNYVAIVHIDGNAMGKKVEAFLEKKFPNNDHYLKEYAQFTKTIDDAYQTAMRQMIAHVMRKYDSWAEVIYGGDKAQMEKYAHVVPLRPVVQSGDDVTFIALGQLGIEMARIFLQYLQQTSMTINGCQFLFDACAGVAIVRRKFPFWLAYELAEGLCANAKKRLKREEKFWSSTEASLIDWEVVTSGDVDPDIERRRERIYLTDEGPLLNRPYYLFRDNGDGRYKHPSNYMTAFLPALKTIKGETDHTSKSNMARSKWKALRSVYHLGRTAAEQWATQNRFKTGQFLYVNVPNRDGKVSAYFYDAIEVMNHIIRLDEVSVQ